MRTVATLLVAALLVAQASAQVQRPVKTNQAKRIEEAIAREAAYLLSLQQPGGGFTKEDDGAIDPGRASS